ncbi:MAG: NnrS family protein [Granulosicoccaceae bacterium]
MLGSELDRTQTPPPAWLQLAFRPFFLAASLYAIVAITLWLGIYVGGLELDLGHLSVYQWHAHEMLFGYSLAVIAGFTLTAAKNWTGVQTVYGTPLLFLLGAWSLARVFMIAGQAELAAICDLGFALALCVALGKPIIQQKHWGQLPIVGILILLFIANAAFYSGAIGWTAQGAHYGVYSGLYLTLGIILLMGRRVVPFFIERGVDGDVHLRNSKSIDIAILGLFAAFAFASLVPSLYAPARYLALGLFIATAYRYAGWYTPLLWQKPLLWSLYIALWFFTFGFFLYFASPLIGVSPFLAVHAFGYAGIGIITLSMMSRVALGHTGRDVQAPPASVALFLALLIAGSAVRVLLPVFLPAAYFQLMILSQALWIAAFATFTIQYYPYLTQARIDGKTG